MRPEGVCKRGICIYDVDVEHLTNIIEHFYLKVVNEHIHLMEIDFEKNLQENTVSGIDIDKRANLKNLPVLKKMRPVGTRRHFSFKI